MKADEFSLHSHHPKIHTGSIAALENNLKEEKFGVLWTFDIKEKLDEKGCHLDEEFIVLEVCNPKEAERILKETKLAGYFLPCKIVVYKEEGQTKIGLPRPTALISILDQRPLQEMAEDIEERLIGCLNKSV